MILPIGTRVWVAVTANRFIERDAWAGEATVVGLIPCSACWQRARATARIAQDVYDAGLTCSAPVGVIVVAPDRRIAVHDDATEALLIPLQTAA